LQLIHHLLDRRAANTTLSHVKAHTDGADAHSVGNRLSDYQANLSRAHPARSSPPNLSQLPLDKCEHHLVITNSDHLVIADDIRRAAMKQLKSAELEHWCGLTTSGIPQGALASEAMVELGRAVLQSGSAKHQSTFLHVATNSIHCYWAADGTFSELNCRGCGVTRSLGHLLNCLHSNSALTFRWELAISIRDSIGAHACTRPWYLATRGLSLRALLASLFPVCATASEEEQQRHFTGPLVGAFTRRQANAAVKFAGFASSEDGHACLLRLRLLCLEQIAKVFGRWKEAACA
jgi:hypothetical protein